MDFRLFVVVLIGLAKFEDKPKARPDLWQRRWGNFIHFILSGIEREESGAHGHVRVI